jgi:RNA recognition motif-containing protein
VLNKDPPSLTLFIDNLSVQTTVQDIMAAFKDYRPVLARRKRYGNYGYIKFNSIGDAMNAKNNLSKTNLDGNSVCLRD